MEPVSWGALITALFTLLAAFIPAYLAHRQEKKEGETDDNKQRFKKALAKAKPGDAAPTVDALAGDQHARVQHALRHRRRQPGDPGEKIDPGQPAE